MTTRQNPEDQPRRRWQTDEERTQLQGRLEAAALDRPPSRTGGRIRHGLIAASLIALAGAGVWTWRRSEKPEVFRRISVAGHQATVVLPDSSIATLGPGTSLRYVLSESRRVVELEGQAYFRVRHDARVPFIVHAHNVTTTDVGTAFIVRGYASDSTVLVAVTDGAVSLRDSVHGTSANLVANATADVSRTGHIATRATGADAASAWTRGELRFWNSTLQSAAEELNRWFDADIHVDSTLRTRRLNATYVKPSLDDVVKAIESSLGVRAVRRGREITLVP